MALDRFPDITCDARVLIPRPGIWAFGRTHMGMLVWFSNNRLSVVQTFKLYVGAGLQWNVPHLPAAGLSCGGRP